MPYLVIRSPANSTTRESPLCYLEIWIWRRLEGQHRNGLAAIEKKLRQVGSIIVFGACWRRLFRLSRVSQSESTFCDSLRMSSTGSRSFSSACPPCEGTGKLSQLPLNIRLLRYTKSSVHVFSIGKVYIFLAIIPARHVHATSARAQRGTTGNVTCAPAQTIAPPAPDASPLRTSNVLGAGDAQDKEIGNPTVNRLLLLATGHTNLRSS
jgi:hypothetical protein